MSVLHSLDPERKSGFDKKASPLMLGHTLAVHAQRVQNLLIESYSHILLHRDFEREANSWAFDMKTLLVGVAIAALVLVNTHAPDIADAQQFKPVIQTPRIIVRPPNVTPPTKRLLKINTPSEATNPEDGYAAETDNRLRRRTLVAIPIPQARPLDEDLNRPISIEDLWRGGSLLAQFMKLNLQDPDNSDESHRDRAEFEEALRQLAAAASEDEDDDPDDCSTLLTQIIQQCGP